MTLSEKLEVMHILQTRHKRAATIPEKQFAAGRLDGFLLACQMFDGDKARLVNMRDAELRYQGKAS